jgi:hypothetical protein
VDRTSWQTGGGVAMQRFTIGDRQRVSWVVRESTAESLREFADDHQGWALSAGEQLMICGQPAQLQLARHAADDFECVITEQGNAPMHVPPRLAVAAAIPNHGMTLLATFEIESEHPDAWSQLARELLGSLRCL